MAPKIDPGEDSFKIKNNQNNTYNKYKAYLDIYYNREQPVGKIKQIISDALEYYIHVDTKIKKIFSPKEIVELAYREKEYFYTAFNIIKKKFNPNKRDNSYDKILQISSNQPMNIEQQIFGTTTFSSHGTNILGHKYEKEIYDKVLNGTASKDDNLALIKHYSWFIAYYKFYVNWILEWCILNPNLGEHMIETKGKIIKPGKRYRLDLGNFKGELLTTRQRKKFELYSFKETLFI